MAKLGSVCRRIYRIFSHAYFHHRQIFDKYEVGVCGKMQNRDLKSYNYTSKYKTYQVYYFTNYNIYAYEQ